MSFRSACPAPHLLAIAVAACLLPAPLLAQQARANGTTRSPPRGTYLITAPVDAGSTAGYAFHARNAERAGPSGTHGAGAAAARAEGAGSRIRFAGDSSVQTTGERAVGLSATEGATISDEGKGPQHPDDGSAGGGLHSRVGLRVSGHGDAQRTCACSRSSR